MDMHGLITPEDSADYLIANQDEPNAIIYRGLMLLCGHENSPSMPELLKRFAEDFKSEGLKTLTDKNNSFAERNYFIRRLARYFDEFFGEPLWSEITRIVSCLLGEAMTDDEVRSAAGKKWKNSSMNSPRAYFDTES